MKLPPNFFVYSVAILFSTLLATPTQAQTLSASRSSSFAYNVQGYFATSDANDSCITRGSNAMLTCPCAVTNRLSAPGSMAVEVGVTMLSQLLYQQVNLA